MPNVRSTAASSSRLDSVTVLHVDDDPALLDLTADALEAADDRFEVLSEEQPAAALDRLDEASVDCVVSDYGMPGMNGVEFLTAVRDQYPDLPFILFTGEGSETVASEAISAGATDYLRKGAERNQYTLLTNRVANAVETATMQRQRRRHLEAIETTQEGISILDDDGRFTYVNESYAALYGYDPAALVGEHWELLYPDEEVGTVRDDILPTVEAEGHWHGHTTGVRADGSTFTEDHVLSTTEGGELVCTVRDITERRARERERRKFESVVENMDDVVALFDEDGVCTYVNGPAADGIGLGRDALIGGPVSELFESDMVVDPDQIEAYEASVEAIRRGERPAASRTLDLRFDGKRRTFDVRLSRIESESGGLLGVACVGRDVTERRRQNRKLEARTKAIEAAIDGVAILDAEGTYAYVNQAHAYVYGYDTPEAFRGESWKLCYDDGEIGRFDEEVWPVFEEQGSWRGEAVGTRRDGSTFPQELSLTRLDDGRVICIVRDISERKAQEAQLEREIRRLDEFASTISHDLRNPLNVAQGRLKLLAETAEDESEHCPVIEDALTRMEEIIEDTLTLAREGKTVDGTEVVSLAEFARTCWNTVGTADAELVVTGDRSLRADPERLRSLLENLFRNSVEHGSTNSRPKADDSVEHDTPSMTIRVGPLDDGFYVEDDGVGIPEADRGDVFDHGFSTDPDSTGLGLASVEQIAEAHGWTVALADTTDGARFEIRF